MTSDCDDWIDETRSIVSDEDFIAGVATPDSDPGRTPRASDSDDDSEDFIKADQPCMGAPAHPHSDADVVDDTLPALGVETEAEDDVPVVMKRPACKSKSIDALIEFMHDIRGPKCERLLNNKTLARKVGLAPSHLNDHIMAIASTSLSSSLSSYATTMKDIMEQCRFVAGRGFQLQPLVFARQRRYDGTQMKVKTQVASIPFDMGNAGVLMQPTQSIVCNPHVITTTLKFGVALGRLTGDERDIILLVGRLPAKLGLVDTCTGETLYEFLRRLEYTFDDSIDKRFSHILDLMTLDDAASNWRGERRYKVDHPGRNRNPKSCQAHKKAKTLEHAMKILKPADSQIIRLALSIRGDVETKILEESRKIIAEQLHVVFAGSCSAEADAYRLDAYNTFLKGDRPIDKYHRIVVSLLFNGDIRLRGRIIHIERGCCQSWNHTCYLMQTIGLNSLYKNRFNVLQRGNWTGAGGSIDGPGLPTIVHGIFTAAYLRAVPQSSTVAAADVAPLAIGDGAPPALAIHDLQAPRHSTWRRWF